jgi:hypothetical protein
MPALLCALWIASGAAMADNTIELSLEGPPAGFGIGVVAGDPSGLAWALRGGGNTMLQGALGYSAVHGSLHANVDLIMELARLHSDEAPNLGFPLYVGIGGRLRIGDYGNKDNDNDDPGIGLRIPCGIQMVPATVPLDLYLEIVPVVRLFPETGAGIDAGLGIRLYPF